jgi:O-antigen ligase
MKKLAYWLSLALIFTFPLEGVIEYPIFGSISRVIGIALAGYWVFMVIITGNFRKPNRFHALAAAFIFWCGISIFWSQNSSRTITSLSTWIQLLLLSLILWDLFTDRAKFLAGFQIYILGTYIVFANTVINYFSGTTYYYERFSANGVNPDDLGSMLALGIPIAWYLCTPKNSAGRMPFFRWVNYGYIPAALLGIVLSGTRTAILATIPGIIFGLATINRLRVGTRIFIMSVLIAAAVYILPMVPQASLDRLSTTGSELSSGSLNGRVALWKQGLAAFEKQPLVGVGSNMYRSTNVEWKVAHNSYVSVLVEEGLIGFFLFLLILGNVFLKAINHSGWDRYFWLTVLVTWAMSASTLTWEYRKPTWMVFSFITISSALAAKSSVHEKEPPANNQPVLLQPYLSSKEG